MKNLHKINNLPFISDDDKIGIIEWYRTGYVPDKRVKVKDGKYYFKIFGKWSTVDLGVNGWIEQGKGKGTKATEFLPEMVIIGE